MPLRIWIDWNRTEPEDIFPARGAEAPPLRTAIGFALIAACSAGFVSAMMHRPGAWSDFQQLTVGARALWTGGNPYLAVITPRMGMPLVYPLTAVLLASPVAWLPAVVADACFSAIGAGALAYAHARTGPIERPAVLVFFSAALAQTVITSQWPALLLGALMLTNRVASGMLMACKPTTAAWLWAARPTWQSALGGACAFSVSLALRPTWPLEWWAATSMVRTYAVVPALLPFGFLIVVATALRWRRPEARLLLAMCCVPHTTFIYETLPLIALVPQTWAEGWLLCAASWICYAGFTALVPLTTPMEQAVHIGGLWSLVFLYAPCAIMLLRRKNE